MKCEPLIRRDKKATNRWHNGDLDVAFQLFAYGMVMDSNLTSKCGRDHLVKNGYAVRHNGVLALTGKGTIAFLTSRAVWMGAFRRWRNCKCNPFTAAPNTIECELRYQVR